MKDKTLENKNIFLPKINSEKNLKINDFPQVSPIKIILYIKIRLQ